MNPILIDELVHVARVFDDFRRQAKRSRHFAIAQRASFFQQPDDALEAVTMARLACYLRARLIGLPASGVKRGQTTLQRLGPSGNVDESGGAQGFEVTATG